MNVRPASVSHTPGRQAGLKSFPRKCLARPREPKTTTDKPFASRCGRALRPNIPMVAPRLLAEDLQGFSPTQGSAVDGNRGIRVAMVDDDRMMRDGRRPPSSAYGQRGHPCRARRRELCDRTERPPWGSSVGLESFPAANSVVPPSVSVWRAVAQSIVDRAFGQALGFLSLRKLKPDAPALATLVLL